MAGQYCRVLSIAGSDSSGGAGIQADLKTMAALGCYGMTAITALTSQNTMGVTAIQAVSPDFFVTQLVAVLDDIGVDAVKIGMLHQAGIVEALAGILDRYDPPNIVLDPVICSQSGKPLLQADAIHLLKRLLLSRALVVMPNLPEAEVLLGYPIKDEKQIRQAARDLHRLGSRNVIIKGGHLASAPVDWLYNGTQDRFRQYAGSRIQTVNDHGTGCTLSSAVACGLAKGLDIEEAVAQAKQYVETALKRGAAYSLGTGRGPLHHLYRLW